MGFGVDDNGSCMRPPEHGFKLPATILRDRQRSEEVAEPPLPLAFESHLAFVDFESDADSDSQLRFGVSCIVNRLNPPTEPGQVVLRYFEGQFRVEHLSAERIAEAQPLRQNAAFFRERTAALTREAIVHQLFWTERPDRELPEAARLFRAPVLLDALRSALDKFTDRTPEELVGKGFPHTFADALAAGGDAGDFTLFHRFVRRHPDCACLLNYPTLALLARTGGSGAAPLVRDLLRDEHPAHMQPSTVLLRTLDPSVPVQTHADNLLVELAQKFELEPADFGLGMVEARLLALAGKHAFTPIELQTMRDQVANGSGTWAVLNGTDRKSGYRAALKWVSDRK